MKKIETEFLIIGSGPGGAAASERLLNSKKEVLMIEEGSDFSCNSFKLNPTDEMLNMWKDAALSPAFGIPSITYAEGKCVGGGTEINSGIIQRVPEEVLNSWSKLPKIDGEYYLKAIHEDYDFIEKKLNASILQDRRNMHSEMLKKVAGLNSWKIDSLPRALKGCTCYEPLCNCGGRQSMTKTFLEDAKKDNAFKLESNTKAIKINFKKNKALSVLAEKKINNTKEKNVNLTKKPTLIAVSKTFNSEDIYPLVDFGHIHFGENRVQEALDKWTKIKEKNSTVKLHLIGKLQTNKVKFAVKIFDYIHTVDSIKLARKISNEENKLKKKN